MEQTADLLRLGVSDANLNAVLRDLGDAYRPCGRRFSQSEEFFLQLEGPITFPSFQIHHDVRQPEPSHEYVDALTEVVRQIARLAPQVLAGLAYAFDPTDILRPCFYEIHRRQGELFLYLLRVDLFMHASGSRLIRRGTNRATASYSSPNLFLEPTLIPLEEVVRNGEEAQSFRVRQTISQTWIGEMRRGYFKQGVWMDGDLTKFFSRLLLPADKRIYPYYPFQCKYKTVCESLIDLDPRGRSAAVPLLEQSLNFLQPVMAKIQEEVRSREFSEDLALYRQLKGQVPPSWYETWKNVRIESYLNESDMKEFRVAD